MRQVLITIIFCIASITLTAQRSSQKGFVVLNNADTIYGWIRYKQQQKTPSVFEFRKDSLTKESIKYSAEDLKAVEIVGGDVFVARTIGRSVPMRTVLVNPSSSGDTVFKQHVFLRVILTSDKLSLYEWQDERERYYLQEADGEFQELLVKKSPSSGYETDLPVYRDQLKQVAMQYGKGEELGREIEYAGYNEHDLKHLVLKLAENATIRIPVSSKAVKAKLSFFAGGGVGLSTIKVQGNPKNLGTLDFGTAVLPYVLGGIDLGFSGRMSRTTVRLEANYTPGASYYSESQAPTTQGKHIYEFQQSNFAIGLSILQSIVNTRVMNVYLGVGGTANFSSYDKNYFRQTYPEATVNNYIAMSKNWLGLNAKAGVVINKKIEIGFVYQFHGEFTNSMGAGFENRVCLIGGSYHF